MTVANLPEGITAYHLGGNRHLIHDENAADIDAAWCVLKGGLPSTADYQHWWQEASWWCIDQECDRETIAFLIEQIGLEAAEFGF